MVENFNGFSFRLITLCEPVLVSVAKEFPLNDATQPVGS